LFVAGIAAIGLLFYFGYDADISKRVALALAAAAIASYIPGFLQVRSNYIRAGGALAVLIVVLFAEDISRDLSPSSKVPGVPSSVKLNKDQLQYQSEISAAQFEISQGNYQTAIETLEHARKLAPRDQLALHMLGNLYFHHTDNLTNAAKAFEQGFKAGGVGSGRFAYNAALAHEAIGETETAKKWIDRAHENQTTLSTDYPALWRDIIYDRGLIYMLNWLRKEAPQRTDTFEVAAASFHEFLDSGVKIAHWGLYNLACLHATAATNEVARQVSAASTYDKVVQYLDQFLRKLHQLPFVVDEDKQAYNFNLARRVLLESPADKPYQRRPGEVVQCPLIKKAWEGANRDWTEIVKQLLPSDSKGLSRQTRL
jgi:tetratricopeptide (TPR) repeat protein